MHWWLHTMHQVVDANGRWMAWNVVLALVPLILALWLFDNEETTDRGPRWWGGLAAFIVFLPNAPYTITDMVHLFDAIRAGASDAEIVTVLAPVYGSLMLAGVIAYVLCIEMVRRYLTRIGGGDYCASAELCLHGLAAIGVYLGRVGRQNSWHVVTDPSQVLRWSFNLAHPTGGALVLAAFLTFVSVTVITRHVARLVQPARRS